MKYGDKIFESKRGKECVGKKTKYRIIKNHKEMCSADATFANYIFLPTNSQTRRILKT
jgi:hypothetical protein